MRVLVIGGSRFIGPRIVRALVDAGHEVTCLSRGKSGSPPEGARHVRADASKEDGFREALAGMELDWAVDTCLGSKNLPWALDALQGRVSHYIHTGSVGVYAPAFTLPVDEDYRPEPVPKITFVEKRAQDDVCFRFAEERGTPVTSLRLSNVLGEGLAPLDCWGARNLGFYRRLMRNEPVTIPNDGRALLCPVYVGDVADAFVLALGREETFGRAYNVPGRHFITLTGYVEALKDIFGSNSAIDYLPLEELLARELPKKTIDEFGARFLCEHCAPSMARARKELGYEPKVGVHEMLERSIDWLRHTGAL